jgi:hypothetical protein
MAKKQITDPAVRQAQKERDKQFESGGWYYFKDSTVDSFGRSKVLRAKFKKKR